MLARLVLSVMIVLLVLGGFGAGVGVLIALQSHHSTRFAAFAGAGTALSAWTWAAVLALGMEMADSLRKLVWAAEGDD